VRALNDNPFPAAAESLARSAVFSGFEDIRSAAIAGLKRHPMDHYAPLLLSGLESPIALDTELHEDGCGGVRFSYSLFQEGALVDLRLTRDLYFGTMIQFDDGSIAAPDDDYAFLFHERFGTVTPGEAAVAKFTATRLNMGKSSIVRADTRGLEVAVKRTNTQIGKHNVVVSEVLRQTTGKDLGAEPMKWWTWWWQDYNEMYKIDDSSDDASPFAARSPKPVYDYRSSGGYFNIVHCSCFAPGTKVWTLTGRRPIEEVKIGDSVLAQDAESGELAYKPVLETTIRQPGPRMKVAFGNETIVASPSHPFWVLGNGE
jgi:hypothetical protein